MSAAVVPIAPLATTGVMLPPFGREVSHARETGKRLNVYIFSTGDRWERAMRRRRTHGPGSALVLPLGEDPAIYRWPAVPNGTLIVAIGEPRKRAFTLAQAVVSCGTPMAFAAFGDNESLVVRASDWRGMEHAS